MCNLKIIRWRISNRKGKERVFVGKKKSSFSTDLDLAENMYNPSDYQSSSEVEQGLASSHEQVSDVYVEGTIDAIIDDSKNDINSKIPREGYENMFKPTE
jgi:hypothetical protein